MIFSIILRTASRVLIPLMLLLSVFLLFRGHNESGGGFIGGLVVASAYALYAAAYGTQRARMALRVSPRDLIAAGLAVALLAGMFPFLLGSGFLTGEWFIAEMGNGTEFKIGSNLFFDIGVYLIVAGMGLTVVFNLDERSDSIFPR
ncbi:MAG: Na+/H+ antiporter subunit B [Bacteroidota bacterium]